jgi:cation:H+ antiporter
MLLFFADVAYPGGPVLNEAGRFSLFAMLLGMAMTTIYLAGFIERRNRAILRMGVDSLLVLCLYVGGLIILFHLR